MDKRRELWIDNIKVVACMLVAVGHFFQSMTTAGIMSETHVYRWFNETIYYFHVPLFFLCSGYLHQKTSCVDSFGSWKTFLIKKAVTLGVPYFTFTLVTWGMKAVFSGSVNSQNQDLFQTLFLTPTAPYWYLYVLFFISVLTPIFRSKGMVQIGIIGAVALKLISLFHNGTQWYIVSKLLANEIWFVLGMAMQSAKFQEVCRTRRWMKVGTGTLLLFVLLSIFVCRGNVDWRVIPLIMGVLGCGAVVLVVLNLPENNIIGTIFSFFSKYTMPIFLMHTIFAAGLRSVLLKVGVHHVVVHIVLGLGITFAGPIIAMELMRRTKLDVLLYPGKYIKQTKS